LTVRLKLLSETTQIHIKYVRLTATQTSGGLRVCSLLHAALMLVVNRQTLMLKNRTDECNLEITACSCVRVSAGSLQSCCPRHCLNWELTQRSKVEVTR